MTRVLVVDDDPGIRTTLAITLRARHYDVDLARDGQGALDTAAAHPPDLVILDLGLPDLDGVQVIHALRRWTDVPILVLSGRTASADKAAALDAGADDYVTKPFGTDELLARLRAARRRAGVPEGAPTVRLGDLVIDLSAHRVLAADGDGEIALTRTEWAVLEPLLRHPGRLMAHRRLLTEIWGPACPQDNDSLRTHLARLRHKLEPDPTRPRHLITEPGMGYRFQP